MPDRRRGLAVRQRRGRAGRPPAGEGVRLGRRSRHVRVDLRARVRRRRRGGRSAPPVPAPTSRPRSRAPARSHGFDGLVAAAAGAHRLCVYGINIAGAGRQLDPASARPSSSADHRSASLDQVVAGPEPGRGVGLGHRPRRRDARHGARLRRRPGHGHGRRRVRARHRARVPALRHRPWLRRDGAAPRPAPTSCVRYGINVAGPGANTHARLPARVRRWVTVRFARLGPHQPGHRLGDGMGHRPRHRGDRHRCTSTSTVWATAIVAAGEPPRRRSSVPALRRRPRVQRIDPRPGRRAPRLRLRHQHRRRRRRTRPSAATTSASRRSAGLDHERPTGAAPSSPAGNPPSATSTTRTSRGSR